MKPAYFTLFIPLLLGGCSVQKHSTGKVLKRVQPVISARKSLQVRPYSGNYYHGDGLGYNISLNLRPDGNYTGVWRGCMGVYGTAKGKWGVERQQIILKPVEETDLMKNHLHSLEIVRYKKKILLVPAANRKHLSEWLPKLPQSVRLSVVCFVKV